MNTAIEIRSTPLNLHLCGLSGPLMNSDYSTSGRAIMAKLMPRLKEHDVRYNGRLLWVYPNDFSIFCCVEAEQPPPATAGLELMSISLTKYAYCKHSGSYNLLGEVHAQMQKELQARNLKTTYPCFEWYGEWSEDESKLVTEVYYGVEG